MTSLRKDGAKPLRKDGSKHLIFEQFYRIRLSITAPIFRLFRYQILRCNKRTFFNPFLK